MPDCGWVKLSNQELGTLGENYAAKWLQKNGYQILDRNWRGTRVELDIVAATKAAIVFVEVKTRRSNSHGYPSEAVTPKKLEHIKSAAIEWLSVRSDDTTLKFRNRLRIDVIAVHFDGKNFDLKHLVGVS